MMSNDRTKGRSNATRTALRFWRSQDGAVTVDWVALTAFILFLGMATTFYVATSVPKVAGKVGQHLEDTPVLGE